MLFVAIVLSGVAAAAVLVVLALGENMLYFYSPTQVRAGDAPTEHLVRIGGMVVEGSVDRGGGLQVRFSLTDYANSIPVVYSGILPDLFREGQGIVARGRLSPAGLFEADEVLAKHDENYMPPEVAEAIRIAKEGGRMPARAPGSGQ